jgi:hypothetical protein
MAASMKQYLVQMFKGYIEDTSVASIDFFICVEEDLTPTAVADLFKMFLTELHDKIKGDDRQDLSEYFCDIFQQASHEFGFDSEYFEGCGWCENAHEGVPLTKVIRLTAMDKFLEDDPEEEGSSYYIFKRDEKGQVSDSYFDETVVGGVLDNAGENSDEGVQRDEKPSDL